MTIRPVGVELFHEDGRTGTTKLIVVFAILRTRLKKGKVVRIHAMKEYRGLGVQLYPFFNLGARWRRAVNFTSRELYPQERTPILKGWVGPIVGLDEYY